MTTQRLEAFSDGVLAIILTIMVLELKVPHGSEFQDLAERWPTFVSYVLSFVYVGIYWNNHHHLLHATKHIGGAIMWGNLHLLFWLSLIPVITAWVGEHPTASAPAALYGVVLLFSALAWVVLEKLIIAKNGSDSTLARAVGHDWKALASPLVYLTGIALAFVQPWLAEACYALVAALWFIPDRRIEKQSHEQPSD